MRILAVVFAMLVCVIPAHSQNRTEIERKRQATLKELEDARKILGETTKKKHSGLNTLVVINRKIFLQDQVINSLTVELRIIDEEIRETEKNIATRNLEIFQIKKEYAGIIYHSYYKRKRYDRIAYLLASGSFNQAYKRIKYIQQYNNYRRDQVEKAGMEIEKQRNELARLEKLAEEKKDLLEKKTRESDDLEREKKNKEILVRDLGKTETKLMAAVREKERTARELQNAINKLIEEERTRRSFTALTPEDKLLSDQFRNNRGKLPWPTERGVVTAFFGENPHPLIRGVKVTNNGIDITTVNGADARALFDGEVRKVVSIPGANKVVIIRHGNYMSMYSNLVEVYVKIGEKVKTKQSIGKVFTDKGDNDKTVLHLEIWDERIVENPMNWLISN